MVFLACIKRITILRGALVLAWVLVFVTGSEASGIASRNTGSLIRRSRVVTRNLDWFQPIPHLIANYCWTSAHQIISDGEEPSSEAYALVSRNIRSGKVRVLSGVSEAIRINSGMLTEIAPSPDGTHFAWCTCYQYFCCGPKGHGLHMCLNQWVEDGSKPVWFENGKHWVAAYGPSSRKPQTSVTVCIFDADGRVSSSTQVPVGENGNRDDFGISFDRAGNICLLRTVGSETPRTYLQAVLRYRHGKLQQSKRPVPVSRTVSPNEFVDTAFCRGRVAWLAVDSNVSRRVGSLAGHSHADKAAVLCIKGEG